jgi:hypothetical protein
VGTHDVYDDLCHRCAAVVGSLPMEVEA